MVGFKATFLRLYFTHVYSLDGAIETWLERPACDKQRSASCKLRTVLKCAQQKIFNTAQIHKISTPNEISQLALWL